MPVTPPLRFNNRITEGVIRGNDATITAGDTDITGLVQEWQISYDRNLARQHDLINGDISYVEAMPAGTLTLSNVAGPLNLPAEVCTDIPVTIKLRPGSTYCNGASEFIYIMSDCVPMRFVMKGSLTPELVLFSAVYQFINLTTEG